MPGTTELEDSFASSASTSVGTLGRRSGKQIQHIYGSGDAPNRKISTANRNLNTIGPHATTLRSRPRTPFAEADTDDRSGRGWSPADRSSSAAKTTTTSSSSALRRPNRTTTTAASAASEPNASVLDVDFWKGSFFSLQALASSALGSDTSPSQSPSSDRRKQCTVRHDNKTFPRKRSFDKGSMSSRPQASREWGPSGAPNGSLRSTIGLGSDDRRRAMIEAQKRQELLMAANADATAPNARGDVKRRSSDHDPNTSSSSSHTPGLSAASENMDADALVYVHHVLPADTMTGVSIRYGCSLAVIRKSNGFWPSDSIQMRKVVLLPVDQCSIKGTRVSENETTIQGSQSQEVHNETNQQFPDPTAISSPDPAPVDSDTSNEREVDGLTWKHETMVHIDGFSKLVEIGRVPRRTLGYFPRARRKSKAKETQGDIRQQLGADTDANYSAISTSSSPSRAPFATLPSCQSNLTLSSRGSRLSNSRDTHRRPPGIPDLLSGPGGIGTLGDSSKAPGPGTDKLNEWVKTHIPQLQIPDTGYADAGSTQEKGPTSLQDIGGAVESWFRKVAERAKTGLNELQQQGNLSPGPRRGRDGSFTSQRGRRFDAAAELGIPEATSASTPVSGGSSGQPPSFVSELIELNETPNSSRKRQEPHDDNDQPKVIDTNAAASRVSARNASSDVGGRKRAVSRQKDDVIEE